MGKAEIAAAPDWWGKGDWQRLPSSSSHMHMNNSKAAELFSQWFPDVQPFTWLIVCLCLSPSAFPLLDFFSFIA